MNILHINSYDVGGAPKAAFRLHNNLLEAGLNSEMFVLAKINRQTSAHFYRKSFFLLQIRQKIRSVVRSVHRDHIDPNYLYKFKNQVDVSKAEAVYAQLPFKPDIIVAHWVSDFISTRTLCNLGRLCNAPLIWYLMDMAPLTGGCHYAWDCRGYTEECGRCPALNSANPYDDSYQQIQEKVLSIRDSDITVVAATTRLAEQAADATVFKGKRIEKIMLGIDSDVYNRVSKRIARATLDLPPDKKIVFIGSLYFWDKRKGATYLLEALQSLKSTYAGVHDDIIVLVAGGSSELEPEISKLFNCKSLGFITSDSKLAAAYQSADLFVCPSVEDSGPMMINESILCGTPIVSFDMGVARDLVHTGLTGYRAELKNSSDLAAGIDHILNLDRDRSETMSEACRQLGVRLCHPRVQTDSFLKLFDTLLKENK